MLRVLPLFLVGCADWFGDGDTGVHTAGGGDSDVGETGDTAPDLTADDARVRALTDVPEGKYPCRAPLLARVTHITDGDTAYMQPEAGGGEMKVRFIGVDAPEIEHDDPAECYGDEATAYTSAALLDHLVWLTFDAECQDYYDRDLAYVINGEGESGFFNRVLARNGYASALAIDPNTTYEDEIDGDVAAAQGENLGMWGDCGG